MTAAVRVTKNIISAVPWGRVARQTAREVRSREVHAPVVSSYRWWARRPHSVIGAILDGATNRFGSGLLVADPFSGGGTVAFEATRRGLRTYAQDVYPWPTSGLAAALLPVDPDEFAKASSALRAQLETCRSQYKRKDGRELSHILRVRKVECLECKKDYAQFPHLMISLASRSQRERSAYFGCPGCASVNKRNRNSKTISCSTCEMQFIVSPRKRQCPHCATQESADRPLKTIMWCPVLVQEVVHSKRGVSAIIRPVDRKDPVKSFTANSLRKLNIPIPKGKETNRLLRAGFKTWADLYTDRQARTLTTAFRIIRSADWPANVKQRLALVILGACEMPAFGTRWERLHPKPFEATSNHRYYSGGLSAEVNLLSPIGRGTVDRRLEASALALRWFVKSAKHLPTLVASAHSSQPGRQRKKWDVLVVTGSSVRQRLADKSVDLVLTDPPYFDDVQYGELARLFHLWLAMYEPTIQVDEQREAAPNSVRGTTATGYRKTIEGCLQECHRTLKRNGRLILTFHNTKLAAWHSLGSALKTAGFSIRSLAVIGAENRNDLCKRNVKAMLADLVVECAPTHSIATPYLAFRPKTVLERNLSAMGLAIATCTATETVAALRDRYREILARNYDCKPIIE